MRTLLIAISSAAALCAGSAFAQTDHNAHHPQGAAGAPARPAAPSAPGEASADMHERCKAVMGPAMKPKQTHDHGRDKTGAPTMPNGRPLSTAEMERMHQQCAAMMKTAEAGGGPNAAR